MVTPERVAAVLLAAGQSRRFGQSDKMLLQLGGQPMVMHAAQMLSMFGLGRLFAVCPLDGDAAVDLVSAKGFTCIRTTQRDGDLSHSLATGVRAVAALPDVSAILICLADMPFVTSQHIQRLLDAHDGGPTSIIASSDGGTSMPPALFGRTHFEALMSLEGDAGARALLTMAKLVHADSAILKDIDRIEDLPG